MGVVMGQACAMFVLVCVCVSGLATKEMERPCPVLGDRLALSNALFSGTQGVGGDVSSCHWPGTGRPAETGGRWHHYSCPAPIHVLLTSLPPC